MSAPDPPSPKNEEEIFQVAAEMPAAERAAYLLTACEGQPALRVRVERLLASHDHDAFMQRPVDRTDSAELQAELARFKPEESEDRIGNYKLLQKIGEGGFGTVWMAEQLEPVRRRVALKIIKPGMDTKEVLVRFEQERQALALMDHPNIAKVLDAGVTPLGRPFFVMELVRGIRITDFCDQNNLPTAQRLDLFIAVCNAIQHAHQKGIIHRDIKPSNILVTLHDGVPVPKVIDFGVAKAIQSQRLTDLTFFTRFEQMIGTPLYMSPEQAEMSGLDVDTRSDIYSLGVLLYELLTGRTPFDPEKLMRQGLDEIRRAIREQEPPKPSTFVSTMAADVRTTVAQHRQVDSVKLLGQIRGDLDWIVMKAIEKDRTRRYATANGFALDIQRYLQSEPVVARPPTPLYRFQKMVRRNKLAFGAAAAVATVLVIGVVVSTSLAIRATRAERVQSRLRGEADKALAGEAVQRLQAENAKANEVRMRHQAEAQELVSRQNAYAADISGASHALDQGNLGLARRLLTGHRPRPGQEDLRGFEWRYLWSLSQGGQLKTFFGHSNYVNCLAYSPDGTILASGSSDRTVKLWNPDTGKLIETWAGHSGDVISVAFSPDGQLLASGGNDGLVRLWDLSSQQIVSTITNRAPRLAFSGRLLAMATGGDEFGADGGIVKLWDYVAKREVMSLPNSGNRAAFSPDGRTLATANWKGLVKLWDVASGQELRTFSSSEVVSLAFSPDSRRLAWCTDSGNVCLWNLTEEEPTFLENGASHGVAFSVDGQTLATANANHGIVLWNVLRREKVDEFRGHGYAVRAVAFSPDGRSLASGSFDDTIMLWNLAAPRTRSEITNVFLHTFHFVGHPVFSPDGRMLATRARTGGIMLWDMDTCQVAALLETDSLPVAFSADGGTLLTRDEPFNSLQQWEISTKTLRGTTALSAIPRDDYYSDAFSFDHKMIATSHRGEQRIILRSALTGEFLFAMQNLELTRSLAFSPDSRLLASGHWNGTAELWDLTTRGLVLALGGFRHAVSSFAFSADGKLFAAASWDSSIKIFDLDGKELATLTGHKSGVGPVAFSTDGKTLASVSKEVKLWNLATGREVITFKADVAVHFVNFSPDGQTLAAGSGSDGIVHLWRAPSFDQIEAQEKTGMRR